MSILEIVIPTVLFMALVALRAEGEAIWWFLLRSDPNLSDCLGGEDFNPVYKNETTFSKDIYPVSFCKAMAKASEGKYEMSNESWKLYIIIDF